MLNGSIKNSLGVFYHSEKMWILSRQFVSEYLQPNPHIFFAILKFYLVDFKLNLNSNGIQIIARLTTVIVVTWHH